jgi:pyridoxal phosphate enzyme (YggS family)
MTLALAIAHNVPLIRARIAAACQRSGRAPDGIRVIAVTKEQGPEVLPSLVAAGIHDFGENRADHLAFMQGSFPKAVFHFIGRVQGRQFPLILPHAKIIHSLASIDHVARLERAAANLDCQVEVFIQIEGGFDPGKAGIRPEDVPRCLGAISASKHVRAVGLMCMAPLNADDSILRRCFAQCRETAAVNGLERLSMGMSDDFEIAVEEGATDLRIGRGFFALGVEP